MSGFNEDFLIGIRLPLPTFSQSVQDEILNGQTSLRHGMIADYLHYSLVMNCNTEKRSPVFVACNIDQNLFKKTNRTDDWEIDKRVGYENQLDNSYYSNNPWDRGHIARRDSSGWGDSPQEAQRGSDETFYYTNCCLQHENYNQDEWLALEDWVHNLDLDEDGRLSVFAGPVYGDFDRTIIPGGRDLARIPCAFWKIVCFKNKNTKKLDVRAFIMYQDEVALKDKQGRKLFNNQTYQSTVMEIERLTGIEFDDAVYEANPLYYHEGNAPDALNVKSTPELIEVSSPEDIIHKGTKRQTINDDIVDIFIAMAKISGDTANKGNGWISLANLGPDTIDLANWTIQDKYNNSITITKQNLNSGTVINPGESKTISPVKPLKLESKGGIIKLNDNKKNRIDRVNYTKKMVSSKRPLLFLSPRDTLDI